MSVNLVVERVVGVNRVIVEEKEGISLDHAYRNLWKTGFSQGAFVLEMDPSYLKTTRRVFKEPGLETATYTGYAGNTKDLAVLNTVAFVHHYVQRKRMGVVRDDKVPLHLVDVIEWVDKNYDPNLNNENNVLNAFLAYNGLLAMISMPRADREYAVRAIHTGELTAQAIKVQYNLSIN